MMQPHTTDGAPTIDRLTPEEVEALNDHLRAAGDAGRQCDPATLAAWMTLQQDVIAGLIEAAQSLADTVAGVQDVARMQNEAILRIMGSLGFVDPPPALKLVGGSVSPGQGHAPPSNTRPAG